MNLNHINLCSREVRRISHVLCEHFEFTSQDTNDDYALLKNGSGFFLVVTKLAADNQAFPKDFHIGFTLDAPADVLAKHAELDGAGLAPTTLKSFEAMGAQWTTFHLMLGDGLQIEVNSYV